MGISGEQRCNEFPQFLSRLVIGLVVAACSLCQVIAGNGTRADTHMPPPDGAPKPSIERHEANAKDESVELAENTPSLRRESKGGKYNEKNLHDKVFMLLLQILRSPK